MGLSISRKNLFVGLVAAATAAGMVGLVYASVPLYKAFCQATGYNGTTQRAEAAPAKPSDQTMLVRFDANISSSLDWSFHPEQLEMKVKIGEQNMAHYRATNMSDRVLTGSAVFNVTPLEAGAYFDKIQCFCFTEQTLGPGESVDLPVVFFVDPAIRDDAGSQAISTITLSYTFYPVSQPKAVSSAAGQAQPTAN